MAPQRQTGHDRNAGQPKKRYGTGAVNYHSGEIVVLVKRRKRRQEIAELLQALLEKHPHETVYVAWDNAFMHRDDEIDAVVRGASGRLVLLQVPTYSPWLNSLQKFLREMLWRHFRREVTHCELFESVKALVEASLDFFRRSQCGAGEGALNHRGQTPTCDLTLLTCPPVLDSSVS